MRRWSLERECQAEAVAYIVSRYLGFENPFARDYLLSYENTAETLMSNLDRACINLHFAGYALTHRPRTCYDHGRDGALLMGVGPLAAIK